MARDHRSQPPERKPGWPDGQDDVINKYGTYEVQRTCGKRVPPDRPGALPPGGGGAAQGRRGVEKKAVGPGRRPPPLHTPQNLCAPEKKPLCKRGRDVLS